MIRCCIVISALFALVGLAQAGKVEVKDVHLCCGMCVKGVGEALKKVDGVTGAKCDQKGKTVTFTTKDEKTTAAALKALVDAGYFGAATDDGKAVKLDVTAPKAGEKADDVIVKGVHVCCKQCQTTIDKLFKDSKVSYSGDGAIKEVKVSGKGLEKAAIQEALQKAGFAGKID
jgi:mercuric ion binding protein